MNYEANYNWSYYIHEKYEPEDFQLFEKWITNYVNNWATCDTLCNHTIGECIEMFPSHDIGGGGTTLTQYGENLLTTYSLLKEEQRKFIENLNRITDLNSGTLKTIKRLSMQISARNQIIGTIEKISLGAVNSEIQMKLKSGKSIVSIITNSSVENLGLAINDEVVAVIKSSNVLLSTQTNLKLSARNSLNGNIEEINIGSVNAEVVVNIGNEDKIVAIVTINSIENMGLKVGASVDVIIKASDIMIGK